MNNKYTISDWIAIAVGLVALLSSAATASACFASIDKTNAIQTMQIETTIAQQKETTAQIALLVADNQQTRLQIAELRIEVSLLSKEFRQFVDRRK